VFVDVDPLTYNLDPARVEAAITPRTKVLLPVHLYGQSADLLRLSEIAVRHGLALVEDAAQAHGAIHAGRSVGAVGTIGCFSFYPGKNLGALGEAGAVVTSDGRIADRLRSLRDHAQAGRHHHVEIGYNARMEGIQGAALDVKLRHLDRWNSARAAHAALYRELLADCPGLQLPYARSPAAHVWHLFVVVLQQAEREAVREALAGQGVAAGLHYPTLVPFQPAYAELGYRPGDFPCAEHVAANCLSLPMYPELTRGQIEHVGARLRELAAGKWVGQRRAA
jgi:dTDP-4-amino-4,6-dideoxygalactose transaminase